MDEVAFQDWPGQPVDLNTGNNPWMPAYGLQPPSATLLEKDDFLGNPDADYFFQDTTSIGNYTYLETIQEETSDDLESDSDDGSDDIERNSPAGWLATDSESGSVICMDHHTDAYDSDREIACPPKRRKKNLKSKLSLSRTTTSTSTTTSDDIDAAEEAEPEEDEETSLSRSSSLLQFETLEKQCQQDSQKSPSIQSHQSQFSFDSLDLTTNSTTSCKRNEFCAGDDLTSSEFEDSNYFKSFGDDDEATIRSKESGSGDSLLYNSSTRYSGSSESSDSDTIFDTSRSCDNLKTWRSFDNFPVSVSNHVGNRRFSSENLSEDSGFGDQFINTSSNKTSSGENILKEKTDNMESRRMKNNKNSYVGFSAYDCDVFQQFTTSNFGISYQDLSIFDRYDPFNGPLSKSSPLTDMFLRKKHARNLLNSKYSCRNSTATTTTTTTQPHNDATAVAINLNININGGGESKYSDFSNFNTVVHAASLPNLCQATKDFAVDIHNSVANVFSVPKDLNFVSNQFNSPVAATTATAATNNNTTTSVSVAEKDWNLADISFDAHSAFADSKSDFCEHSDFIFSPYDRFPFRNNEYLNRNESSIMSNNHYKREGSYSEAMRNRVDLSDDENSLIYKKKLPKSPIVDFDRRVLKAISEQSLQSLVGSNLSLQGSQKFLNKPDITTSTPVKTYENSNIARSTPELNQFELVASVVAKPKEIKYESDHHDYDDKNVNVNEDIIETIPTTINQYPVVEVVDKPKMEDDQKPKIKQNMLLDEWQVPLRRKESIIKSSTSTSGMSDIEDRTLRNSVKSFTGSTGSKGVHFSPIVAEVNWKDNASSSTPDLQSTSSINSSSPEPEPPVHRSSNQRLLKPKPRYVKSRRSISQPDLSDNESRMYKREFIDSLNSLRAHDMEICRSQPDMSKMKRRGSQLIKRDKDGCTIKAYVDGDGIQYKHTHLDLKSLSQSSMSDLNGGDNGGGGGSMTESGKVGSKSGSKNSLTSKFPFHSTNDTNQNTKPMNNYSSGSGKQFTTSMRRETNVNVMMAEESEPTTRIIEDSRSRLKGQKQHKSGLGGFFHRLASFRLGAKKGQEQKDKLKRTNQGNGATTQAQMSQLLPGDNPKVKPQYIYIPLKGAENSKTTTVAAPVLSKPPLPRQPPPRVVHASMKKTQAQCGGAAGGLEDRRRRRTIDSGSVGVESIAISSGRNCSSRDVERPHGNASMDGPMGLIETDLDTEVTVITGGANARARSLLDLGPVDPRLTVPQNAESGGGGGGQQNNSGRPHKSMEFLLDKQNLKVVEPPENELQKSERIMSEHELRVQRSLQKLPVPDWYKQSDIPSQGFLLKKHNNTTRETRWTGTGSKTTSLSSLGSYGGTHSPQLVLSPTPCNYNHHQQQQLQPTFVRASTSKLNSTASSPCQSTRSSFNHGRQQPNGSISPSSIRSSFSYRPSYMGWRSQERLNKPRTPAERLANSLLSQQQQQQQEPENPEIQTSIKEVTSAIVHYVSGLKPNATNTNDYQAATTTTTLSDNLDSTSQFSGSVSPRGSQKLCWLESSFVGSKPTDSPETPLTCSESPIPPPLLPVSSSTPTTTTVPSLRLELQNCSSNDLTTQDSTTEPTEDSKLKLSPSTATLDDVIESLLCLPSTGRAASPCPQETVSASTSPQRRLSDTTAVDGVYRRRSEGSEPAIGRLDPSMPTPTLLRCRYSRCGKTALVTSEEAQKFKHCHNCSYTYCSRSCRKSHWERHRKICLSLRMGTLCREVIAAAKEKKDTLKELSIVAKRGHISHGLGAVKCFYPNPEAAESFLTDGLTSLGELAFIRWQDLLPSEMGPQLYEELVQMCKNYNPETKFVLYVSICVVSERPASGAIKWERQLVSRCAKMRLSKDLNLLGTELEMAERPETVIFTCAPIRLQTPETTMRARLIAFHNIQEQLAQRGVSLKEQYPDVFKQLYIYSKRKNHSRCESHTIYPKNANTNKRFICVIMLESDKDSLRQIEKASVKVKTIDVLLSSEITST